MKLLLWDGSGVVLLAKRLEQGSFRWPSIGDGVMRLTASQLSALLEGLDWTRVRAVRVHAPQSDAVNSDTVTQPAIGARQQGRDVIQCRP